MYYSKVPYEKITDIVAHHTQYVPDEDSRPPIPTLGKKVTSFNVKGVIQQVFSKSQICDRALFLSSLYPRHPMHSAFTSCRRSRQ